MVNMNVAGGKAIASFMRDSAACSYGEEHQHIDSCSFPKDTYQNGYYLLAGWLDLYAESLVGRKWEGRSTGVLCGCTHAL